MVGPGEAVCCGGCADVSRAGCRRAWGSVPACGRCFDVAFACLQSYEKARKKKANGQVCCAVPARLGWGGVAEARVGWGVRGPWLPFWPRFKPGPCANIGLCRRPAGSSWHFVRAAIALRLRRCRVVFAPLSRCVCAVVARPLRRHRWGTAAQGLGHDGCRAAAARAAPPAISPCTPCNLCLAGKSSPASRPVPAPSVQSVSR